VLPQVTAGPSWPAGQSARLQRENTYLLAWALITLFAVG